MIKKIKIPDSYGNTLKNINLDLPSPGITVITGPSGSGKTTLLNAVAESNSQDVTIVQVNTKRASGDLGEALGVTQEFASILFAYGESVCHMCGSPLRFLTKSEILSAVTKEFSNSLIAVCSKLGSIEEKDTLRKLDELGASKVYVKGILLDFESIDSDKISPNEIIEAVVDRIEVNNSSANRLKESIELALNVANFGITIRDLNNSERFAAFSSNKIICLCCGSVVSKFVKEDISSERLVERWNSIQLHKKTGWQLINSELKDLMKELGSWKELTSENKIPSLLSLLCNLGLGHLCLKTPIEALSSGENRKLVLALNISSNVGDILAADNPCGWLHYIDRKAILDTLPKLARSGTVLIADCDFQAVKRASKTITLGPSKGINSCNIASFKKAESIVISADCHYKNFIHLKRTSFGNIKDLNIAIPLGGIVCVTGVSGSSKNSLVWGALIPLIKMCITNKSATSAMPQLGEISLDNFSKEVRVTTNPGETDPHSKRSIVASYLGAMEDLRELFTNTIAARMKGATKSSFSLTNQKSSQDYTSDLSDIRLKGYSFSDILRLSFQEARNVISHLKTIRKLLVYLTALSLDHLLVGQELSTLGSGELMRLSIARQLAKQRPRDIHIINHPTLALDDFQVDELTALFSDLSKKGTSIISIDNNPRFVLKSDYVIEMGPGAGIYGGKVTFAGSPKELLESRESVTAACCREYLDYLSS